MAIEMHRGPGEGSEQVVHPVKFSRYRSVRQAASKRREQEHPPLPSLSTTTSTSTITRSRSRYRLAKPARQQQQQQPQTPVVPDVVDANGSGQSFSPSKDISTDRDDHREKWNHETFGHEETTIRHRQDAMDRLMQGRSASARSRSASRKPTSRRDDRRVHEDNRSAHHIQTSDEEDDTNNHRHNNVEKTEDHAKTGQTSSREKESAGLSRSKGFNNHHHHHHSPHKTKPEKDASGTPNYIEVGGGGAVPGIDAPVSAVNAGERKVLVKYRQSAIDLAVNPSTRAKDLLYSAATCLTGGIDPKTFIIMESFTQLGLERPLRRYEHVRDVMNSWFSDGENSLIIVPASSEAALEQLQLQNAPANPPSEPTFFYLYHSQRLGKWEKRYVTLHPDGQVTLSKKESSKEQTNICHLSDFDIYSTSTRDLPRKFSSSKRLCFAVKSLQKASMFLSTEKFVHYFATDDEGVARAFHAAIQTWRSWYLVNKIGAGGKKIPEESATTTPAASELDQVGSFKPLLDLNPFKESQEGKFTDQPQLQSNSRELYTRKTSARGHAPPPSSFPRGLAVDSDAGTTDSESDAIPFSPTGLLGRTYDRHQLTVREREREEREINRTNQNPFSNAQGLIHCQFPLRAPLSSHSRPNTPPSHSNSRANSLHSTHASDHHCHCHCHSGDLKRSKPLAQKSQQQQQKPLVDLTPTYQEPPQHVRKGRGVKVEPGVTLVDAVTSREQNQHPNGIIIPPATTWRRPVAMSPPPAPPANTLVDRERQSRKRSNTTRDIRPQYHPQLPYINMTTSPATSPTTRDVSPHAQTQETTFIPNSLLARTNMNFAEHGVPKGHGVATGDRNATKPLLDLSDPNLFSKGSLLELKYMNNMNMRA